MTCYLVQFRTNKDESWQNIAMTGGKNAKSEAERTVNDCNRCMANGEVPTGEYRFTEYKA